ncbi:hypothetical protein [Exiguobacterium sp.]|uniref:hypothetical protein n=1 Tax=Exiguobacterium sp. TaxID=44751 RepID=UPI000E90D026|nr:hypothetical protein [Exiguobacterium sp.]HBF59711.1 hypothetical protein [Exiguobacterium sp.]
MAETYDVFDELLLGIDDENNENNVVANQDIGSELRTATWAMDWRTGRFGGKVDGDMATVHRTAKYMVTARGQVDVYPKITTLDDVETDFYGSYLYTLVNRAFPSVEDIENEIQAYCELAVTELPDVESISVGNVTLDGDKVAFSFYITPNNGTTEEVSIDGIGI